MNRRTFIKKAALLPVVGAMLAAIAPAPPTVDLSDAIGQLDSRVDGIIFGEYDELDGFPFVISEHTHPLSPYLARMQRSDFSWMDLDNA